MRAFIGAATAQGEGGSASGISVIDISDLDGGTITEQATVDAGVGDPMYLVLNQDRTALYASHAVNDGMVSAWTVQESGLVGLGSPQSTHGRTPCHLSIDPSGRHLLNADYGSGSISVHPILDDGSLGAASEIIQHTGTGPTARQKGPHAHMIVPDEARGHILAVDLGADSIFRYALDVDSGRLRVIDAIALPAGSGPRHLVIQDHLAYVANELDSTVSVVNLDAGSVALTISSLPDGSDAVSYPSAIRLSPDGRFLYVANRGPDTVAAFAVNAGQLELVHTVSTGGVHPRDLHLAPDGSHVYVANQFSDTITSFAREESSGALTPVGEPFATPSPACIVFG